MIFRSHPFEGRGHFREIRVVGQVNNPVLGVQKQIGRRLRVERREVDVVKHKSNFKRVYEHRESQRNKGHRGLNFWGFIEANQFFIKKTSVPSVSL